MANLLPTPKRNLDTTHAVLIHHVIIEQPQRRLL